MYCECEYGDGRLPLLFIVNPAAHSGEGYALWKQAEAVLQERSIPYEVYFSEKRGDVRQLFGSVISQPVRVTIWRGILRLGTTSGL